MAKTGKLVRSKSAKQFYLTYPDRYAKNRRSKLERHVLAFPDDKVAEKALDGKFEYRRNTRGKEANPKRPSEEKIRERRKMLEIHVKSLPRIPEPAFVGVLRELAKAMKPKIRYKRGKKIKT